MLLIGASRANILDKQSLHFAAISSRILVPEASSCESADGEDRVKCVDRAPPHNILDTLFVKDLAMAQGGVQSARLVHVYGISIRNRSGCSPGGSAFFTSNDTEWRRIS